jgi:hypothetical protein
MVVQGEDDDDDDDADVDVAVSTVWSRYTKHSITQTPSQ